MEINYKKSFVFVFSFVFLLTPFFYSHASTIVDTDITQNTTWTSRNSPYIISGPVQIPIGVKLNIKGGVIVQSDGTYNTIFLIGGTLSVNGASDNKDKDRDDDKDDKYDRNDKNNRDNRHDRDDNNWWDNFWGKGDRDNHDDWNDKNKNVIFDGVSIQGYNHTNVSLKNTIIKNIVGVAVQVWDNSTLDADNLTIDTVSDSGILVFANSVLNLKNSTIKNFGAFSSGLMVFGDSTATIQNSVIDTGGDGIVAFNHASIDADRLTIKNCSDGGIISFGNDSFANTNIKLRYTEITNSGFGIYPIDHTTLDIVNNSIHGNTIGVINSTGIYNFANNWWGDKSGPYNVTSNVGGKGNEVLDGITFTPWLKKDPLAKGSGKKDDDRKGKCSDYDKKKFIKQGKDRKETILKNNFKKFR